MPNFLYNILRGLASNNNFADKLASCKSPGIDFIIDDHNRYKQKLIFTLYTL